MGKRNYLNTVKEIAIDIFDGEEYGVIVFDKKGIVQFLNQSGAQLLKVKNNDVLQSHYSCLGYGFHKVVDQAIINDVLVKDSIIDFKTSAGVKKYLSCSMYDFPQLKEGGLYCLVVHDETHMIERDNVVEKMERFATIGSMAAHIAHDIKNPLVALKTFVELFPIKYNDAEFRETFSKIALKEIVRIEEMVSQLHDFSGSKDLMLEDIELYKVIEDTLNLFSIKLSTQQIRVKKIVDNTYTKVRADYGKIRRVLNNLILNAIDAMPHGGTLSVSSDVKIMYDESAKKDIEVIEVSIVDTGRGINSEEIHRVFEPFFTTKISGSGLGLAICKKIIEDHKGKINVFSSERGTVFVIQLLAIRSQNVSAGTAPLQEKENVLCRS